MKLLSVKVALIRYRDVLEKFNFFLEFLGQILGILSTAQAMRKEFHVDPILSSLENDSFSKKSIFSAGFNRLPPPKHIKMPKSTIAQSPYGTSEPTWYDSNMKKDCRGTFDEDYALLRLSVEAGIDEDLQETPSNWFELGKAAVHAPHTTSLPKPVAGQAAQPSAKTPDFANLKPNLAMPFIDSQNTNEARDLAAKARTLEELETFLKSFEGCALKKTATNTVFADGNSKSGLMLIGEAPGAEEDRQGKPFVGPAGQLLDRMMAAIGLTREAFYITNVCFWRPPGNRKPSEAEWAACRPFVTRHIELVQPRVIFLLGGSAAQQVLNRPEGITRLRGHWNEWANPAGRPIPTLATFHPAYLLRQPAAKRESWRDLIRLRKMLDQSVT